MPASTSSFTFRCGECNRLLGVSRSRIGATVTCPKCGTELIVPRPEDEPAESGRGTSEPVTPPASISGESAAALAGASSFLAGLGTGAAGPGPGEAASPFPAVAIETEPFSLRPSESARAHRVPDRSRPAPSPPRTEPPAAEPGPALVPTDLEPLRIPPISTDSLSAELRASTRSSDVVMPRTAFLLWSFVMLAALAVAFLSGLLAGRALWSGTGLPLNAPPAATPAERGLAAPPPAR
jgi:phage FluMu protein Com